MTIDEIRKNAPVGATHYADDRFGFDYVRINEHGKLYIFSARYSEWLPVFSTQCHNIKPL